VNSRKLLTRPELGAFVAAVGTFLFFASVASEGFLSFSGTINYLEVSAQVGVVAVAVSLLMIAGEFDLSVGSMIGAAGMIIALAVTQFWLAALAGDHRRFSILLGSRLHQRMAGDHNQAAFFHYHIGFDVPASRAYHRVHPFDYQCYSRFRSERLHGRRFPGFVQFHLQRLSFR
jgi:hypothetical protein